MWTRKEVKEQGKTRLRANYLMCVIAGLIFMVFHLGTTAFSGSGAKDQVQDQVDLDSVIAGMDPAMLTAVVAIFLGVVIGSMVISVIIQTFIAGPFCVGARKFFLLNRTEEKAGLGNVLYAFKSGNYLKIAGTMFLKGLFIDLWSLLFVIPGIVKGYSYWMVEFIMAENPSIGYKRAFEISRKTMNGEKWNVFVFDWSFILWNLLSVVTCGLSYVFYSNPYILASEAELYAKLREKALAERIAEPEELPGV